MKITKNDVGRKVMLRNSEICNILEFNEDVIMFPDNCPVLLDNHSYYTDTGQLEFDSPVSVFDILCFIDETGVINPLLTSESDLVWTEGFGLTRVKKDGTKEILGSKEGEALRYNGIKTEMDRLPLDCLAEVAKVLQKSAKKYPDNADGTHNWEKLWNDRTDAILRGCIMRHLMDIQSGEDLDSDSELSHYAHIACNALFGIRYHLNKKKLKEK